MSLALFLVVDPIGCLTNGTTIRSHFASTAFVGARLITSGIRTGCHGGSWHCTTNVTFLDFGNVPLLMLMMLLLPGNAPRVGGRFLVLINTDLSTYLSMWFTVSLCAEGCPYLEYKRFKGMGGYARQPHSPAANRFELSFPPFRKYDNSDPSAYRLKRTTFVWISGF